MDDQLRLFAVTWDAAKTIDDVVDVLDLSRLWEGHATRAIVQAYASFLAERGKLPKKMGSSPGPRLDVPCEVCGRRPTFRLRFTEGGECWLCEHCEQANNREDREPIEVGMIVPVRDGRALQVAKAALLDESGRKIGVFLDADSLLWEWAEHGDAEMVALVTVGSPRKDITGVVVCDYIRRDA
jgi:hypothetical protein